MKILWSLDRLVLVKPVHFLIDIFTILIFFVISSDFMVSETLEVVYE